MALKNSYPSSCTPNSTPPDTPDPFQTGNMSLWPVLSMTDQASLRRVVRVGVSPSKAQSSIPRISSSDILRSKSRDLGLGSKTSSMSSIAGIAYIDELITNTVGDDVWVQGFLLTFVDGWIDGLEGEFCVRTTVESGFKFHCWCADAEVQAEGRCCCVG